MVEGARYRYTYISWRLGTRYTNAMGKRKHKGRKFQSMVLEGPPPPASSPTPTPPPPAQRGGDLASVTAWVMAAVLRAGKRGGAPIFLEEPCPDVVFDSAFCQACRARLEREAAGCPVPEAYVGSDGGLLRREWVESVVVAEHAAQAHAAGAAKVAQWLPKLCSTRRDSHVYGAAPCTPAYLADRLTGLGAWVDIWVHVGDVQPLERVFSQWSTELMAKHRDEPDPIRRCRLVYTGAADCPAGPEPPEAVLHFVRAHPAEAAELADAQLQKRPPYHVTVNGASAEEKLAHVATITISTSCAAYARRAESEVERLSVARAENGAKWLDSSRAAVAIPPSIRSGFGPHPEPMLPLLAVSLFLGKHGKALRELQARVGCRLVLVPVSPGDRHGTHVVRSELPLKEDGADQVWAAVCDKLERVCPLTRYDDWYF